MLATRIESDTSLREPDKKLRNGQANDISNPVKKSADHIITEKQKTFFSKWEHLRITSKKDIPEPDPILSIQGNIISTQKTSR